MGKGIKAGKKAKSNLENKTYKDGKQDGLADAIELITALLMQDYGFTQEDIKSFIQKIIAWKDYANEPTLPFYISTVRKINKDNGINIRRR